MLVFRAGSRSVVPSSHKVRTIRACTRSKAGRGWACHHINIIVQATSCVPCSHHQHNRKSTNTADGQSYVSVMAVKEDRNAGVATAQKDSGISAESMESTAAS